MWDRVKVISSILSLDSVWEGRVFQFQWNSLWVSKSSFQKGFFGVLWVCKVRKEFKRFGTLGLINERTGESWKGFRSFHLRSLFYSNLFWVVDLTVVESLNFLLWIFLTKTKWVGSKWLRLEVYILNSRQLTPSLEKVLEVQSRISFYPLQIFNLNFRDSFPESWILIR